MSTSNPFDCKFYISLTNGENEFDNLWIFDSCVDEVNYDNNQGYSIYSVWFMDGDEKVDQYDFSSPIDRIHWLGAQNIILGWTYEVEWIYGVDDYVIEEVGSCNLIPCLVDLNVIRVDVNAF